jgi:predicted  nucleic acid-binding Zn-ribbon protein
MDEIQELEKEIETTKGYIEDRARIVNKLEELLAERIKELDNQKLMLTGYQRRLAQQMERLDFEKRLIGRI